MKSWMAAMRGSPLRGVTMLAFVYRVVIQHWSVTQLLPSESHFELLNATFLLTFLTQVTIS